MIADKISPPTLTAGVMMETVKSTCNSAKRSPMTPKAIIHQRFGDKANYEVEEVQDLTQKGCPGLAVRQKGPCLYRCTLLLPEIVVVSDTFKKKKDAEQSAAEIAIEKLGIHQKEYNPTILEAWDDLTERLAFLFSIEFLSSPHPLSGHFRAALRRESHFNGCVPVSVIALYDTRIGNICKHINSGAESSSLLVMSLVLEAAAKQTDMVLSVEEQLSLKRRNPYPPAIIQPSIDHESSLCNGSTIEVVRIPSSRDKDVQMLKLNIAVTGYYLDVIAQELGVCEASNVLISRTIGKASSELRIYSPAPPKRHLWYHSSERDAKHHIHLEGSLNERASYFIGQFVYGDAILASIGYTWKSTDLFHEAVSLRTYYRILVNKMPNGAYKISRDALLAAKLPLAFTTRSNWRGSLPRDVLCSICRFHHVSEPVFSVQLISLDSSQDLPGSHKKMKVMETDREEESEAGVAASCGDLVGSTEAFTCEVKICTKNQELILQCSPRKAYRKQIDAIQSAALKVLSWLDIFLEKPDTPFEKLNAIAEKLDIHLSLRYFSNEFASSDSDHKCGITIAQARKLINYSCSSDVGKDEPYFVVVGGQNSGVTPSNGSLASVCYSVSLVTDGDSLKEHLESCEEFEFEFGNEAVLPDLEAAVAQMAVGQSSNFQTELVPCEFILAAAGDSAVTLSLLSSARSCKLEYNVTLLRVTEPLEERMEQALFSPPLSKQRVEFAVQHIKNVSASSLVDFGCGSGSLLDSLLLYPTSLEKIVGVDISQRSLARAARSLHTKLNSLLDAKDTSSVIKSAVLYDGSITAYDSRLHGFDIATCLEVIEHMEEKDACLFGDVVLSSFCPKILIVSTPNYEYNVILQGSTPQSQEEDPDEEKQAQSCKFRNHDHKFEWTRSQFNQWASDLAAKHNYSVAFSGVGGSADTEPGFASQIAIFKRYDDDYDHDLEAQMEFGHQYADVWEWNIEDLLSKKE
ncbi:small RNA 2'-O-methyltransferase-like [Dorcoceras hygrometricum]|uniref:Small RNA 2'-O-methyltransferase n=1 Tax=Dorcoceras hygrometricum TaxID=472368 RepID=A0A2Z7BZ38_9LAMI|nr:small RNA 2'-O-methyltransferase-like [Dorcoceras hygrometricum]